MILSDGEIREAINRRRIIVDPEPGSEQYATSALDLLLGEQMFRLKTEQEIGQEEPPGVNRPITIDPLTVEIPLLAERYATPLPRESDGSFILPPRMFALGITREQIDLPRKSKIAARVEGRSTLARLGLVVHLTAPTIHSGFKGRIALEMYNFGEYPIRLAPGRLAICQLIFERLGRVPRGVRESRYQGQRSVR